MTLENYRRPRMVIQSPDTPVYEAVRAMESNRIGIVVVQDRGEVVGVVTDRDIALRIAGNRLNSSNIPLQDVMSPNPVILPLTATEPEALDLMRSRGIRRIPLHDGERIAGFITIDDLILSETADRHAIAEVIRAQLSEPAELKPAGETHPVKPARPRDRAET